MFESSRIFIVLKSRLMFLHNWHIKLLFAHDRCYMTWITKLFSNKAGYFILLSTEILSGRY